MDSRAKALGHAMHPMLIVFPLGLLTTAVVFDILYLITDRPGFPIAAAYAVAGGVLGGLAASLPGWVDWSAIPVGTRAKRVGLLHGVGNLVVVVLFALSWLLRAGAVDWEPSTWALVLGFAGAALSGVTGWLGGELVDRLGVGVTDGAHLDAPSSLSGRPATATAAPGAHGTA
jgi:uncharacterized membrane protein